MKHFNLNENEFKALMAICAGCDDIEGEGFTRPANMVLAVMEEFGFNGQVAGGYISDLQNKGLIDVYSEDDEVWVSEDAMELYYSC